MTAPDHRVSVAVVYDSGSRGNPAYRGRTSAVAKSIVRGAESVVGTQVALVPVAVRGGAWDLLDAADAIVFGCPTYMGSGSAAMKEFMEETLRPQFLEQRWKDKLAAGFTNSAGMSGDKLLTLQQLAGFASQHGMVWISLGQLPGWQDSQGSSDDLNRLASFLGLMTKSNSDEGPATSPPRSDRATAELFGRRIAELAHRWVSSDEDLRTGAPTPGRPHTFVRHRARNGQTSRHDLVRVPLAARFKACGESDARPTVRER